MNTYNLNAKLRENLGKKATKKSREQELIPSVLYGRDETLHILISEKEVKNLIYTPYVYLIKINVNGKTHDAMLQDLQFHPVTDKVLHIDFLQIFDDKPIKINVPVKLVGFAEGVKAGGKLYLLNRYLKVKAFPKDVPDELVINIDSLVLGKSIKVGELNLDNIEIMNPKDDVVCSVRLTRVAKGMEAAEAVEGALATKEETAADEKSGDKQDD